MSLLKFDKGFFLHTRFTDGNDRITPSGILNYFQDIAGYHAGKINIGYDDMLKKNLAWVTVVTNFHVADLSRLKILQNITVSTWPKAPTKLEFEREYEIKEEDGTLLCYGDSIWCLIDMDKRNLVRSSNAPYDGEFYDFTRYPNSISRKLKFDIENPDGTYYYKIEANDVDHNRHLNNAKYLEYIQNIVGLNRYITDLTISFVHEAKLGETLKITHQLLDGEDYFIGYVNEVISFMVKAKTMEVKND